MGVPSPSGDRDALLREGRRRCRQITRDNGTTYYWGTHFLAPDQRVDVYGIYALCRLADDIVDEPDKPDVVNLGLDLTEGPEARLLALERRFHQARDHGGDPDPVMHAVATTVAHLDLDASVFDRFFAAMRLDLTRTSWATWEELRDIYMEGSAAVIGEMMLPVLRPRSPAAKEPARSLGLAFQLTNFIRDVGDDLARGRVYLPEEDLARHGADPWARQVTPQWRSFLREQIARNRELYVRAQTGLPLLPAASARCVAAALAMYGAILDRVERADYDVFTERHRVPTAAKAALVARALAAEPGSEHSRIPVRRIPQPDSERLRSTWRVATPARIEQSLRIARTGDPGGWFVVGGSGEVADRSVVRTVAGREVALWRADDGTLRAGPGACPHLGAKLHDCVVTEGDLLCRWHGMRLPSESPRGWRTLPALDDGVLLWVRIEQPGECPTPTPRLAQRPPLGSSVAAIHTRSARCEPQDIVANRLDPWHGAWFHPYAFSHLTVDEDASTAERLVTDVTFRLGRTFGVPVRAEFTCPDARTVAMTITDGEGTGSIVETHATPIGTDAAGRPVTVMTEATIAHSDRAGFRAARAFSPLVRALMERTQARLWVDDLAYAERRHEMRMKVTR